MKKILAIMISVFLILPFSACNSRTVEKEEDGIQIDKSEKNAGEDQENDGIGEIESQEIPILRIGAANDFKYGVQDSLSLVTDFMIGFNERFEPIPNLISDWEINDDATEFELHLRKDVKFHDGTNFNAEVCKYDLESLGKLFYSAYINNLESIEILDDYSLAVKFKKSNLGFIEELYKIPAFTIDSIDEDGNLVDYTGTGPFKLEDYKEDEEAKLSRNDDYWNKDKLPKIEELKWYVIPDPDARALALQSSQVDIIGISEHGKSMSHSSIEIFNNDDDYKLIRERLDSYTSVSAIRLNWLKEPMDDIYLRKALAYAIDREAMAEDIYFGEVNPVGHMMNPEFIDGSKKVDEFYYDLEKAKEILKEGDYKLEGDKLTKDGKPVELNILTVSEIEYKDASVFIQKEFEKLGIKSNIEVYDFSLWNEKMKSGEYDIALMAHWFEPTYSNIAFYGLEPADNTGFGLGYGMNKEMINAGNGILNAKNQDELRKYLDDFWIENYEQVNSIPVFADFRTAIYKSDFEGFKFDSNYFLIDLSEVKLAK
ncbi:MAG: ABC transporter substrate-binding protein [Tissierellia bacterium]|nr:ABC transporter substrate-binding protein [Tissierellia bacterium]